MKQILQEKKGVAGLNVYLSLIVMLFMIGIIVMVFLIAGTKLRGAVDDPEAKDSINQTTQSIKGSTDFFPTFIVLGSMVVLVLLTVIIINSIRATGITQEGA
jgi:Na+/melibiose symporter-like transporter